MAKSKAKNNTVTSLVSGTFPDIPGKIWRLRPYFFEKSPGVFRFFNYNPFTISPTPSSFLEMSRLKTNIPETLPL